MRRLLGRRREAEEGPADDAGDAALVRAAQADPLAFDPIYERYEAPILNYCYARLGSWADAEDAAQQIFTNAYAGLGRFRVREGEGSQVPGSFRSWLFTIAHNEVANRYRRSARHPAAPIEAADEVLDPAPSPEELAVAADSHRRLRALLDGLSSDQRRVVELRLAGLTDTEIGAVLGRNPGAVRAVQARAVARLRDALGVRPANLAGQGGKGGGNV